MNTKIKNYVTPIVEVNCSQSVNNLFHSQRQRLPVQSALSDYNTINCDLLGLSRLQVATRRRDATRRQRCLSFINEVPKLGLVCRCCIKRHLQPKEIELKTGNRFKWMDATSSLVALNAGGDCNLWPRQKAFTSKVATPLAATKPAMAILTCFSIRIR